MNTLMRGLFACVCVVSVGCVGNTAAPNQRAAERPRAGDQTLSQPAEASIPAPETTPAPADPPAPTPLAPPPSVPTPAEPAAPPPAAPWAEASPGLRVSREARALEFDGTVPIDVHGKAPRVFLEVLVCTRDTREHESLVVTDVKPSSVHAALLMLGLVPGAPGSWQFEHATLTSTPPNGPRLTVSIRFEKDGATVTEPIDSWVANLRGGPSLAERDPGQHLVFAGSRFVTRDGADTYAADADGTLVGLTAFGSETIAWTAMYHPDSAVEQPQWVADPARVPVFGTKVTVVITAAE